MSKQTAVEWYEKEINFLIEKYEAKEMEKEQKIDAWEDGQHSFSSRNAEQYYKETFED